MSAKYSYLNHLEEASRIICEKRNLDPEERCNMPNDHGYAVGSPCTRWQLIAREIERHMQIEDALHLVQNR